MRRWRHRGRRAASAFGDLDNDGFIDVAVNCLNGPAVILRNGGGNGNHWLLVNTVGDRQQSGRHRRPDSRESGESGFEQFGIVSTAGSYQSANDKRVHFGLGADKTAKLVEIMWPSGRRQELENVAADQVLTVREPGG